jgi:Ulp1 family protease
MQFNADKLSGLYVKAPVQPNHTDCGVYLLHYMELFFNEDPDGVFLKCVMRSDEIKYWFTIKDIVEKRRYLWELMDRMKFEYCRQVTAQYDAASSLATAASPLKVQDQIEP